MAKSSSRCCSRTHPSHPKRHPPSRPRVLSTLTYRSCEPAAGNRFQDLGLCVKEGGAVRTHRFPGVTCSLPRLPSLQSPPPPPPPPSGHLQEAGSASLQRSRSGPFPPPLPRLTPQKRRSAAQILPFASPPPARTPLPARFQRGSSGECQARGQGFRGEDREGGRPNNPFSGTPEHERLPVSPSLPPFLGATCLHVGSTASGAAPDTPPPKSHVLKRQTGPAFSHLPDRESLKDSVILSQERKETFSRACLENGGGEERGAHRC